MRVVWNEEEEKKKSGALLYERIFPGKESYVDEADVFYSSNVLLCMHVALYVIFMILGSLENVKKCGLVSCRITSKTKGSGHLLIHFQKCKNQKCNA